MFKPEIALARSLAGVPCRRCDEEGRMGVMKALWASVQGDPVFMRRVNGWFTIFWMAMIPVSIATGWVNSVAYVSALSLWGTRLRTLVSLAGRAGRGGAGTRNPQA
jgi:hypothetical protein